MKALKLFESKHRILNKAYKIVAQVETFKEEFQSLSNNDLKARTQLFFKRLELGETIDDLLPEALATVREAAFRAHGLFAYPVQLIGAIIIYMGDFAEMRTGEGKTLTISLAAYIASLDRKGVHVVTVNEYLVKRDAEFCRKILNFLGLTVGFNTSELSRDIKKQMFACDVTYTTNSELGFDYLRDNMVKNYSEKVIPRLNYAIIDEGDSVLIDEARTPLIISGQPQENVSYYVQVDRFAKTLIPGDFKVDPESRSVTLLTSGIKKAEAHFKIPNLYSFEYSDLIHKINNALSANFVFENGKEYVVKDDKILLVDHFTGRILQGRSYNAGLHQAIQAKESVKIEPENIVVATITYQSFFRLYKKLSSLSGTALTEAQEFAKTYNMVVVPIPTNKPVIRKDNPDLIFGNKKSKWKAAIVEIKKRFLTGQPVLVGTSSVDDSEILHQMLVKEGIPHEILNARNHGREAEIIAKAGLKHSITISTNMAGRGTDIKIPKNSKELGGLFVLSTERNESRRIDNQLRGRSGRQGDPGESTFFISLEDDLFKRFATDRFEKLSKKIEDEHFDSKFFSRSLSNIQKKVESVNFDTRKNLIEYDQVLSYQRELIYKQRDYILTTDNCAGIVKRINSKIVKELIKVFVDAKNTSVINHELLAESLNEKLFKYPMILNNDFFDLTISEAENFLLKILNKMVDLKQAALTVKTTNMMLREILIDNLDYGWQSHIDFMSKLRDSVSLRSFEQKSPLHIYIEEGDIAFNKFLNDTGYSVVHTFLNYNIPGINSQCFDYIQDLRKERLEKIKQQLNLGDQVKLDAAEIFDEKNILKPQEFNEDNSALMQLKRLQEQAMQKSQQSNNES